MFKVLAIFWHDIVRIYFFSILKFIERILKIRVLWQLILVGSAYQKKSFINYGWNIIIRVGKIIKFSILLYFLKSLDFPAQHLIIQWNFYDSFKIWVINVSAIINQSKRSLINFLTNSKFIINNLTFYFTRKQINFFMDLTAIFLVLVLRWLNCFYIVGTEYRTCNMWFCINILGFSQVFVFGLVDILVDCFMSLFCHHFINL